jgi:hypothetical protein
MHDMNWPITSIHLNNRAADANFKPMLIRPQDNSAAWPQRHAAKVMVGVLAGPDAPLVATAEHLSRWRRLTPLAMWSTIPVRDAGADEILRGIAAELARAEVEARWLILLGEGKAARTALGLVLQGALDCAGVLAIAMSCAALPFRIASTAAAVRLVARCEASEDAPDDLIGALRAADIDERIIMLNPASACDAQTAASAAETFVLELVANTSRRGSHGV